jgi:hypothetical protein
MMGDGTLCYVDTGINEKRFAAADCFGAAIEEIRAPEISPRIHYISESRFIV